MCKEEINSMSAGIENVYGYIRVSTETQADKGYGLETQRDAIITYCKEKNLNLVTIYKDEGISGVLGDKEDLSYREGISEMLSDIDEPEINKIVVMNTSRLWRDTNAQVLISRAITKYKGDIVSIEQPKYSLYSTDPSDFLFNAMMNILDQYDRMCISRKLKAGKNTKAKNGERPEGRLPYGYYSSNKKSILDNEKAKEIKIIFNSFIKSDKSTTKTDRYIKANNSALYKKINLSQQKIHTIVHNPYYAGFIVSNNKKEKTTSVYQGIHKPLINKDLWNECNPKNTYGMLISKL